MIKRSSALFVILACLLILVACDSQIKTQYTLEEFETTVSVNVNDEQITATLNYYSPTDICLTFISPQELESMTVNFIEGEKVIYLGEVSINLNEVQNLTSSENMISVLYEVLGNFGSIPQLINEAGKLSCKGESIYGDYSVTFDCDEMKITSISSNEYYFVFT